MTAYSEIDAYCCRILRANITRGWLPEGDVIEGDMREVADDTWRRYRQLHLFAGIGGIPLGFRWAGWPYEWSLVTGGFPCQPHSEAGVRRGEDDPRYLWPAMFGVVCAVRPAWVLVENVRGILTDGTAERVCDDLDRAGYQTWPVMVAASDCGAWHRRQRVWIVAYAAQWFSWREGEAPTDDERKTTSRDSAVGTQPDPNRRDRSTDHGGGVRARGRAQTERREESALAGGCDPGWWPNPRGPYQLGEWQRLLANSNRQRRKELRVENAAEPVSQRDHTDRLDLPPAAGAGYWQPEPALGGAVHGLPGWLAGPDRARAVTAIGNAVVPQVVAWIARAMIRYEEEEG